MTESLVQAAPRQLSNDLSVGPLGFGCWRLTSDVATATELVGTALDAGLSLIDNADVYGLDWGGSGFGACEALLGDVLAANPSFRDRMVLATKGGIAPPVPYDSSPAAITAACEASLQRLRVDSIDLYQVHRPDMYTNPHDLATALTRLRDAGKIREVGVSNYTVPQYDALAACLDFPIATTQPEFSVAHLDPMRDGTFDGAMRDRVTPLAWSPLAGGAVATGDGLPTELTGVLDELAEREGVDRATVAIAFVLSHPSAPVAILGTQRPERLTASLAAMTVHLDRGDVYRIVQASEGVPLP